MQSQKAFDMPVQEYHESFWDLCVQLYHKIEHTCQIEIVQQYTANKSI